MRILRSERLAAALLLSAAVLGLVVANSPFGPAVIDAMDHHLEMPALGLDLSSSSWPSSSSGNS